MSTFDGKCLSYDSTKQVVNKEPTATKVTIERMYRSHRERMQKTRTVIDDHVVIPDFMKSQRWREMDKERKQRLLEIDNEHHWKRLEKVGTQMSTYTAASIEHMHLVNSMKKHMIRLKEHSRERRLSQIKHENELMQRRLQMINPKTTRAPTATTERSAISRYVYYIAIRMNSVHCSDFYPSLTHVLNVNVQSDGSDGGSPHTGCERAAAKTIALIALDCQGKRF
jgi:hypothetical protein